MKLHATLGMTAVLATVMMTNAASAAPWCWGLVKSPSDPGGSCCMEERLTVLGAPTSAAVVQAPSLITDDGGTAYDVFAQGWDNAVWTRHFDGLSWGSWSSLGGVTTSRPTGVAASAGHVYVFARGTDYAVWYRERTAMTWGPWRTLGGYVIGGVGAAAWDSGEVEVFAHGGDHALWKNSLIGTTAGGWSSLGGVLFGEPNAGHVTHAAGGETIEAWVMRSDGLVARRRHDRTPVTIGSYTTWMDTWRAWQAVLSGTYGGVGLMEHSDPDFIHFTVRNDAGHVWWGPANATGVTAILELAPITTRSDVCVAPSVPGEEHYAYVDQGSSVINEFHFEKVCSSCGDGRCYGAESCSSCPNDCGSCVTCGNGVCDGSESCSSCSADCGACKPPVNSCQDYEFCSKADLSATTGFTIKGFGCNIVDARKDAWKKVVGGFLVDGPCPPAACPSGTPSFTQWCCEDTGTTWGGTGCSKDDADDNAKRDDSCETWTEGICD